MNRPRFNDLLPESCVTDAQVVLKRRRALRALTGAGLGVLGASSLGIRVAEAQEQDEDPSAHLYPAQGNPTYASADVGNQAYPITPSRITAVYNNYYEFFSGIGTSKSIWKQAQALPLRPWRLEIDGFVEKPLAFEIDDLLAAMPLEERIYRHRCVETWAMTVPWSGFPLAALVKRAAPLASAKFLRFETFNKPEIAIGQRESRYPWPYIEGLTMAEASNDLAFMATGVYGQPLPKQMGAPLRLALPWKYGFKSAKGLVRITFTDKQPISFWEHLNRREYGFWANVNPQVAHPRWSQAHEQDIGTGERRPTLPYNGYGEQVASLYSDKSSLGDRLFR